MRICTKTSVPSISMSDCGLCGDYFEKNFYNQFKVDDEAIVASAVAIDLITEILQTESNRSESSQFVKEIAIAENIDGYIKNSEIYLQSYKCIDGLIREIPIYFCYELTEQRIIDFVTERQEWLFNTLRIPETKNSHLRFLSLVTVSKVSVSNERLGVNFEFSFHVTDNEDFFIDILGKNRIRYKLRKDQHGQSFFTIKASYHQEFK